jgi:uncharacterized OB-fold protein
MYRAYLTLLAIILALSPAMLPASSAQEASLEIIVNEPDCVAKVLVGGNMLTPVESGRYVAAAPSSGVASIVIQLKDLGCRASVEGDLARNPFIEADKLYVDVVLKKGVNLVRITFSYNRAPQVYATITPTNPGCIANITANAPVKPVDGYYVAGPWRKGSQAELVAHPAPECYVAGWMQGDKAASKNEIYVFPAEENVSLTVSAETRGSNPPPQLMDFTYLSVTAKGPGKVIVSTTPITGHAPGTPRWEGIVSPGSIVYLEAVPEGCGRLARWRGLKALEAVDTESVAINVPAGFVTVEAVFEEMSPCPYIAIGSLRLMHVNDLPIVAGGGGAAAAAAIAYRAVTSSRKREKSYRDVEEKWINDVLKTNLAFASPSYKALLELIDRYRPLIPGTLTSLLKAVQEGAMDELLRELEAARDIHQRLYLIYEYEAMGRKTAFNQGLWAGHLLTFLLACRGYAPATREVLSAWVKKMSVVSSAEDADRNVEMLWTDHELKTLQKQELEKITEALRRDGVEHVLHNPPKAIAVLAEEVMKTILSNQCPSCGAKIRPGSSYCISCGTKLLQRASRAEQPEHPVIEEAGQPKLKPAEEEEPIQITCPHCGKTVPKKRYCIGCGAILIKTVDRNIVAEGKTLREQLSKLRTRQEKPVAPPPAREPQPEKHEEPPRLEESMPLEAKPAETQRGSAPKPEEAKPEPPAHSETITEPAAPTPTHHEEREPVKHTKLKAVNVEWEVPSWIMNNIEGLVSEEELKQAVEKVAHEENVEKAAYRAASLLAQGRVFPTDGDRASFITSLSSVIPFAINEYRAAQRQAAEENAETEAVKRQEQGEEPEKPAQTPTRVPLRALLESPPQRFTAYLVDEVVKAPTLPEQFIKNLLSSAPYRVVTPEELKSVNEAQGMPLVAVTCAVFTSNLLRRKARPDARFLRHLMDMGLKIALLRGYPLITHSSVLDTLEATGYQRVYIDFDLENIRRRLVAKHPYLEALAPAEAIIPGVADALVEGDAELRQLLVSILGDEKVAELFERAVKVATSLTTSQEKRDVRTALLGLGLVKATEVDKQEVDNDV